MRKSHISSLPAEGVGGGRRLETIATTLVFALSIFITVLPYWANAPAVPFGSDMQHPQALLNLLNTGAPLSLYPDYLNQQYPNTYAYLLGLFAKLMKMAPLDTITLVTSLCMIASLAAIYFFARQLYGKLAATLAALAYGVLSFQPRQTYLDGTRIELVSGLVLVPLCLLALHQAFTKTGWNWSAIAGLFFAALIRYHFIGTVQAALATGLWMALVVVFRRDLITRKAIVRLLVLMGIAALASLPYSFYYAQIGAKIALGRLGLMPVAAEQEASFPPISGFDEVLSRLGPLFALCGLIALCAVPISRLTKRKPPAADLLVLAWVVMLAFGTFTSTLIVPERFLRNLAMPLSIAIGAFLAALGAKKATAVLVIAALIVGSLPPVFENVVYTAAQTTYATPDDVVAMTKLQDIIKRDNRVTLSDDSGVWMPYFVGERSRYIAGGLEGFLWFGEPLRSEMRELWMAHLDPCAPTSAATFDKFEIGYIYLGDRPAHWTLPGYAYLDGGAYLACPAFKMDFSQNTASGTIYIFERQTPMPPPPAWAPPEGITPQNSLGITPPLPAPNSSDESYFRLWHRNVVLGTTNVTGLSATEILSRFIASPRASSEFLLKEANALRRAAQVGVKGNPNNPYADFKLFLTFNQPNVWPPNTLPYALAIDKTIELPKSGAFTPAIQWWYAANRAKYNTVYYGVEDADPAIHLNWAATHSDVDLYNEVMAIWDAAKDGVVGSVDHPRQAFDAWLAAKLAK